MQELIAEFAALAVYGPAVVLVHELGHATLARAGGYRVTSFGVGLGRPVWRTRLRRGVVLWLAPGVFLGGACTAIPTGPASARRAWFHVGGLLAQALLALLLFALPHSWWLDRIAQFNLLVALTNLLPWRLAGQASDGWQLWSLVRRSDPGELLLRRPQLARLSAREHAARSPLGALYADLCLAWLDLLVGRTALAGPFFRSDPDASALDPWIDALYHYVHAEWHRIEGRPLAALRAARLTHLAVEGEVHEAGSDLVRLAEARALVDLEADRQAHRALAHLAGVGGIIGRQARAVALLASLSEPSEALDRACRGVIALTHHSWLDPIDTVHCLLRAAEVVEGSRPQAAAAARAAARDLAHRVRQAAAVEDRDALARRIGDLPGPAPHAQREATT